MEALYYLFAFLMLASLVLGIVGLIRPTLFKNKGVPDRFVNRISIVVAALVLTVVFVSIAGAVEPDSIKQERISRELAAQQEKERKAKEQSENEAKLAAEQAAQETQKPTSEEPQPVINERDYWHKVVSVTDGDTVRAMVDGKEEAIRIIGIDAPESTTSQECFGVEASAKAKEFLNGKWIQLEKDTSQDNRDKYNRLLRYVWFDNGTDFGRRMIEEGYAFEYTYQVPYQKQAQYKETQSSSQSKSLGLWSTTTCSGQKVKPAAPKTQAPAPTPTPAPKPSSNCDPNYTGGCVPIVSYDLDCSDISFSVKVVGTDKHRFDGNGDGYGCESN